MTIIVRFLFVVVVIVITKEQVWSPSQLSLAGAHTHSDVRPISRIVLKISRTRRSSWSEILEHESVSTPKRLRPMDKNMLNFRNENQMASIAEAVVNGTWNILYKDHEWIPQLCIGLQECSTASKPSKFIA